MNPTPPARAALDQFPETLPGAHGVAELLNFIVLLLKQQRTGPLK